MNSDLSGYFTLGDFSVSNAISGIISQTYNASFAMAVWSGFIGGLVAVGDQLSTGNYDPYDLFFAFGDGAICGFSFGLVAQFMPIKILMALSGLGVVGGFAGAIQSFSDSEFWQGIYRTSLSALGGVGFWKAFGSQVKGYVSNLTKLSKNNNPTKATKYPNFTALKKALGSPGEGKHWHHIVEQCQAKPTRSNFDVGDINTYSNVRATPDAVHNEISAYYSRKHNFTDNKTLRNWLNGKSYEVQHEFGLERWEYFMTKHGYDID